MNKPYSLKKIFALTLAFTLTMGVVSGSSINYEVATAEESSFLSTGEESSENSDDTENTEEPPADETQEEEPSTGFDVTAYAEQLRIIAEKQKELEESISETEDKIKDEEKQQKILQQKIDNLNEEIKVLNSYLTALEIQISSNKRQIEKKQLEIENGIESFKKRLRAMYIAGSDSYTTMILESNSFYDVLMRLELIKRVANHDNDMIDDLLKLKAEYENTEKQLEEQKTEYDKQCAQYEAEKAKLDELYNSSEETKKALEKKQKLLEEQSKAFDQERSSYEADLSGILKSWNSSTSRDQEIQATMLLADSRLEELHNAINQRIADGEEIPEDECTYEFAWPVPGYYNVSSGVGPRWGSYHTGLDITGPHGTDICASESGTVLRTNMTCTHDYGKSESCGCGNGYGNYVIIDHGNDFITLYGHLTEVDVNPGDTVKKGDVIGKMGTTGFSTGDHLHLEIRYQGYVLNPAFYVDVV